MLPILRPPNSLVNKIDPHYLISKSHDDRGEDWIARNWGAFPIPHF